MCQQAKALTGALDHGSWCLRFLARVTRMGRPGLVDGFSLQECDGGNRSRDRRSSLRDCVSKAGSALVVDADPKGGVVYLLGSCELARGRPQAAGEAWARVVPGTAFSDRAIRSRMRLFRDSGHFADAERFLLDAARDPRNDRTAVLVLLVPIYADQGRVEEAQRLLVDRWEYLDAMGEGALEPAINLVRQHVELTLKGTPVETVHAALERAATQAPDDDRVWLGRANLALRTGAFVEARRWLDLCQERRPDDLPVRPPDWTGASQPTRSTSCDRP